MPASYDLVTDYVNPDGTFSVSPHWVIMVDRLKERVTFDRTKGTPNRSRSDSDAAAVEDREPLVIYGDCISLQTRTAKDSHLSSLNATLAKSTVEYNDEIMPGDWVMAWVVNSKEKVDQLINDIMSLKPVNGFADGFKFLGRVDSLRKISSRDRNLGTPTYRYQLNASGFTEFDSKIFYDSRIMIEQSFGRWLTRLGKSITELSIITSTSTQDAGALDINKILPFFVQLFLGEGIPDASRNPANDERLLQTPNTAYVVPNAIASLLGRNPGGGVISYANIIDTVIGVQHFSGNSDLDNDPAIFLADGQAINGSRIKQLTIPLSGQFVPVIPSLDMTPVWEIFKQFLNPGVNEMYTCLRVDANKAVVPHLIIRELPFRTQISNKDNPHLEHEPTHLLELPRWLLSPDLVYEANIGRSNAMRFNIVHITGIAPGYNPEASKLSYINNPPVRDDEDIKRSGLRPYIMTTTCSIKKARNATPEWTEHMTDILMGQHLQLNGTLTCLGIVSPICEGDNLSYEGYVYHIEGVQHSCAIDPNGNKNFETTLFLSHGMADEVTTKDNITQGAREDEAMYGLKSPAGGGTFDQSVSVEPFKDH